MMRLKTKDLLPGMELSRDVANLEGRTLLRKGLALTSRHILALKAWGIDSVCVIDDAGEGADCPVAEAMSQEERDRIEKELNERLRYTERRHPLIDTIHRIILRQRIGG